MEAQKLQLSREKKDLQCKEKELERKGRAQQDSMEVGDTILKKHMQNCKQPCRIRILKRYLLLKPVIEAAQKKICTTNTGMQQAREQRRSVSKRK